MSTSSAASCSAILPRASLLYAISTVSNTLTLRPSCWPNRSPKTRAEDGEEAECSCWVRVWWSAMDITTSGWMRISSADEMLSALAALMALRATVEGV